MRTLAIEVFLLPRASIYLPTGAICSSPFFTSGFLATGFFTALGAIFFGAGFFFGGNLFEGLILGSKIGEFFPRSIIAAADAARPRDFPLTSKTAFSIIFIQIRLKPWGRDPKDESQV